MNDIIRITADPISIDETVRELGAAASAADPPGTDREAGALVTFSGIVRETEDGRAIPHLDYEHYPRMAEREMEKLVAQARERWPLGRVALVHRTGPILVGEPSVIVAVLAGHRAEAFDAARFLIDELKKSVPIWKTATKQKM